MTIGIIGLGSIGERHARNLQALYPRARIDILTKRNSWDGTAKNTRLVADERAFFDAGHDVYFITNESGKHTSTIKRCLARAPKGIFVEKPLCMNARDAKSIERAVAKYRGVFFVGYCLQFFKPLVELKKLLDAGVIGTPYAMRVVAGKDMRTWRVRDWRRSYSSAKGEGGVIFDLIHELNYPSWLLGEPLSLVTGALGRLQLDIAEEDTAVSLFRSKKGVVVSIFQDYLQQPGQRECQIFGSKGTLTWSRLLRRGSDVNELRIDLPEKSRVRFVRANGNDMYLAETRFFMARVNKRMRYTNVGEAVRDVLNAEALKRHGTRIK